MNRERHRRGYDFEIVKVPQEFVDLGRRRTSKMLTWQTDKLTLSDLLANAYLQGIEDAVQAHINNPALARS